MIEDLKNDDLIQKLGGRFKLTALIQRRWLEILHGARPMVETKGLSDLEVVIREIAEGKVEPRHWEGEEEADDVEDFVPTKFVPPAPRMTGVQSREKWAWELMDETKIPRKYLSINYSKINQEVTLKKGATKIPGIMVYKDMIIAGSRG